MESAELVIVLLIDFMNQNHIEITMDALKEKTGIQEEELNRVIGKLRQIENVIDIERTTG